MRTPPQFIVNPGEILTEEYLVPLGLSQHDFAIERGKLPAELAAISPHPDITAQRFFFDRRHAWKNTSASRPMVNHSR